MRRSVVSILAALSVSCAATKSLDVDVAPPTGDRERDRASVRAALDSVRPGGTVQFATGTYRIGGEVLALRTSDVTLRGNPGGTVLQGCGAGQLASMKEEEYFAGCNGIALVGGRQHVRELTFEGFTASLTIQAPPASQDEPARPNTEGGHVIEGNTFRNSTTVEVHVDSDATVLIQDNTFRNTYHAVAVLGRNVHVLRNDVAAPQPRDVPFGWPSVAIGVRPDPGVPCSGNRVEGNTIDGHTDAVALAVGPPDGPGAVCEGNVIRGNTVRVRPLVYPEFVGPPLAGEPLSGVPIRLLNLQQALVSGTWVLPLPPGTPPWPASFAQSAIRGNTVEGNHITGARGVAIELLHAADNRVAGNRVEGTVPFSAEELDRMAATPPFGIGPGFWIRQPDAADVNGSDIYSGPAAAAAGTEDARP